MHPTLVKAMKAEAAKKTAEEIEATKNEIAGLRAELAAVREQIEIQTLALGELSESLKAKPR